MPCDQRACEAEVDARDTWGRTIGWFERFWSGDGGRWSRSVTYEEVVEDVVRLTEVVGAAILVLGGLWSVVVFARDAARPERRPQAYADVRRSLGRVILLGLEVLIIADIVRTIVVDPTIESVVVLGLIVGIRIILSFSLEVEMDGAWPWQRWRLRPGPESGDRAPPVPPPG